MSRRLLVIIAIILIVGGSVAMSSLFIVDPTEQVLVLQFGQPRRVIRTPGLYVKRPFIQNVVYYDKRLLDFEPPTEEVIGSDQKRIVIDTYTRYRIVNPLLFYQTVATEAGVRNRLEALVSASLRRVVGDVPLSALLSAQRADIMLKIRNEVRVEAKGFGIAVVDVRIRRADLPPENSEAIYARMQSERQQQARQYRGEGAEAAQKVRANADRERTVILADARRDAQKLRGAGDAASIGIYAGAYEKDPRFYAFYRSLQAYRHALSGQRTSFVLTPEGSFFRFFKGWEGAPPPAPAGAPPAAAPPPTGGAGGLPAKHTSLGQAPHSQIGAAGTPPDQMRSGPAAVPGSH